MENPINEAGKTATAAATATTAAAAATAMRRGSNGWRSKAEEYEMINNLNGFDNLRAMLEGEATRRKKNRRGKKNKKNKTESQLQAHNSVPEEVKVQTPCKGEAVRMAEVSKTDLIEFSEANMPTKLGVDKVLKETKMIETAQTGLQVDTTLKENKIIETAQAVKSTIEVGDEAGYSFCSKDAIDLQFPSSQDDDLISNVSTKKRTLEKVLVEATIDDNGETVRRKVFKTVVAEETDDAGKQKLLAENAKCVKIAKSPETHESAQNTVLRKLLRKPRYFDPPNGSWTGCLTCGDDHPTGANCTSRKKVKTCFLCGSLKHIWKNCTAQGQFCFVGRRRGHQANGCPKKQEENSLTSNICLRCGDSGHDMFSCRNDYSPDDLKKIQCYTCKGLGHLFCVKIPATSPTEVSCFKCGESGHLGSDCTKCPKVGRGSSTHVSCYRCREEGHFARTCSRSKKSAKRVRAEMRTSLGSSSAPPNLHRPHNDAERKMQETVIMDSDL